MAPSRSLSSTIRIFATPAPDGKPTDPSRTANAAAGCPFRNRGVFPGAAPLSRLLDQTLGGRAGLARHFGAGEHAGDFLASLRRAERQHARRDAGADVVLDDL